MKSSYDVGIVGAGIVGLSTTLQLSRKFPHLSLAVFEKESQIAAHQTGHNSGVIHSGIYYRPRTLKAQLCVAGAAAMASFCAEHNLPYEICGKLIIATTLEEMNGLRELERRAEANGVAGVRLLGKTEIREFEPHAEGIAALHVPSAGIASYSAVAKKFAELAKNSSAEIFTNAAVLSIGTSNSSHTIETAAGTTHVRFLINCAGLQSDLVAVMSGVRPNLRIVPFRGEYYELVAQRRKLIRGLIYPVPDPRFPFLGVHFTRRVTGQIEAGPNAVLAFKREGYKKTDFSIPDSLKAIGYGGLWKMAGRYWRTGMHEMWRSLSKGAFVTALQRLVPEIQSDDLVPAGSGVRAQAVGADGALLDDFYFLPHGNALHVCNVPSPAATASLMIGEKIVEMAASQFSLASSD
ncbi:MAG TPA: L-2-hydroxyglutarate oxidase [Terriglobales bacterium]|nr:L-2-hydroxyglutarate oxidase [Terriglobales bacterium]